MDRTEVDTQSQMILPLDAPAPAVQDWREQVPSVSQLTRRLRGHIENSFFDVWVKGEVSNFRKPISGHAYFILKDATAQLKGVMFKGQLSKLKFQLQDGMEILLHGSVSVYEARGEYQLVADNAEPVGVGALQLAFEQLKLKLHKEGLFDAKHKMALPTLPKRIGVVTSATGAAVRDILKVLSRRYPDREVFIIPAAVQGEKAAGDIVAGIKAAHSWNEQHPERPIEVLIVGRGGGSLEDLWPFNEEIVARAIYASTIPIISAVGHEIDFTIADFVADLRAPTPSAAAEIVVPKKEELLSHLQHVQKRKVLLMKKRLEQLKIHVGHLSARIISPKQKIQKSKEAFKVCNHKLITCLRNRMRLERQRLQGKVQMLESLSPLKVIGRGYSLTLKTDGSLVKSVKDVTVGEAIQTKLANGVLESTVTKVG